MDFLMSAPQQSFASGITFNLFANSNPPGSDANNGLTAATAKATLAAINALSPTAPSGIALIAGSSWRDRLAPPNGIGLIGSSGAGANPIIDGAKVLPNANFTLSSGTIYSVTLSCDPNALIVGGGGTYMMWVNGAWLAHDTTGTPPVGTFFVANAVNNVVPGGSVTALVNNGTAIPTDGNVYEYTFFDASIELYNFNNAVLTGVVGRRTSGYYGPVHAGLNSTLNRCLSALAGRHNFVIGSGVMNDCIAFDADNRAPLSDNGTLIVFYTPDGTGRSYTVNRCMAIMPAGRTATGSFLSHGSTAPHDFATINGFIAVNAGVVALTTTQGATLNDVFCTGAGGGIFGVLSSPTVINRALVNKGTISTTSNGPSGLAHSFLDCAVYTDQGAFPIGGDQPSIYTAKYNTSVKDTPNGTPISFTAQAGSIVTNNIAVLGATAVNNDFLSVNPVAGVSVDRNVYVNLASGNTFSWRDGTSGTRYFTLAAWQAATGFDTHSVLLNAAQAAQLFLNPANLVNGDFRINPACTLTFPDGTPIVGNAGPRSYYDWNQAKVVNGQPFRWWVPPATEAQSKTYIANPPAWSF